MSRRESNIVNAPYWTSTRGRLSACSFNFFRNRYGSSNRCHHLRKKLCLGSTRTGNKDCERPPLLKYTHVRHFKFKCHFRDGGRVSSVGFRHAMAHGNDRFPHFYRYNQSKRWPTPRHAGFASSERKRRLSMSTIFGVLSHSKNRYIDTSPRTALQDRVRK